MKRIRITLKDGTMFEYEDQYFWGIDLDDHLRKGEQFLQTKQAIIRIDSIYHIAWEDVPEEKQNESSIRGNRSNCSNNGHIRCANTIICVIRT